MPDWLWFVVIGGPVWLAVAGCALCLGRAARLGDDALRRRR